MVAAVVVWGIVQIYKYSKGIHDRDEHRERIRRERHEDDYNGFLVGGLVMIFIGLAFSTLNYGVPGTEEPAFAFVSLIIGGIGSALLISFVVLSLLRSSISNIGKPARKTTKKGRK